MGARSSRQRARAAISALSPGERALIKAHFRHLAARRDSSSTIDKETMMQLIPLPGMLGERLFSIWDGDRDQALSLDDFVGLVAILVRGTDEERYRLLYDMFNVAEDDGVSMDELIIMFNSMHPDQDGSPETSGERSPHWETLTGPSRAQAVTQLLSDITQVENELEHATSLDNIDQAYMLVDRKAHLEQSLSHCGLAPVDGHAATLESYLENHETAQAALRKLAEHAIESASNNANPNGKLTFEQFYAWSKKHAVVFDALFHSEAVESLRRLLNPTPLDAARVQEHPSEVLFGYFYNTPPRRRGRPTTAHMRYYVLQEYFLYQYAKREDAHSATPSPREAIFMRGNTVVGSVVTEEDARHPMQRTMSSSRSNVSSSSVANGSLTPPSLSRNTSSNNLYASERELDRSISREQQRRDRSRSPGPASSRGPLHLEGKSSADEANLPRVPSGYSMVTSADLLRRTPSLPNDHGHLPPAGNGHGGADHDHGHGRAQHDHVDALRVPVPLRPALNRSFTIDGTSTSTAASSESGSSRPTSPDGSEHDQQLFKIEISLAAHKDHLWTLYTTDQTMFHTWMQALTEAAEVQHFEDDYTIDLAQQLGSGQYADVYVCYARRALGPKETPADLERYACKIVYKTGLSLHEVDLCRHEVACLRLLHHPNIVALEAFYDTPLRMFLVVELLEGGSLLERLTTQGAFPIARGRLVIKQICFGVSYLHMCGLIHRDIKPGNLVFTSRQDDAIVKIVDFGLSIFAPRGREFLKEHVGTVKYWAPELMRDHIGDEMPTYDRQVDMWSIGTITYLTLTARFPFEATSETELRTRISEARYDKQSPHWRALPAQAKDFISRLLVVNPEERMTAEDALAHPWIARDPSQQQQQQRTSQPNTPPRNVTPHQ